MNKIRCDAYTCVHNVCKEKRYYCEYEVKILPTIGGVCNKFKSKRKR